jgi:hypothetical protein
MEKVDWGVDGLRKILWYAYWLKAVEGGRTIAPVDYNGKSILTESEYQDKYGKP